jgi:signal transduction histidine kinase
MIDKYRPKFVFSLRLRLLTSYLILLIVTLGIIASALILLISNRPAPPEPTYERLATLTQGLNIRDFISNQALNSNLAFIQDEIPEFLDTFSESRNIRTLHLRITQSSAMVMYDSANIYQTDEDIPIFLANYRNERLDKVLMRGVEQIYGGFTDPDGSDWLFGGVVLLPPPRRNNNDARNNNDGNSVNHLWILSESRPTVSLQAALADFSSALALPLIQAAIVGIVFAVILAALISRTIAKPLQRVAHAAADVAGGDYGVHVPVSGPPEVRAVAESFNQMTSEVRTAHSSQRDFLANVSHDLKTPLTSIQGYSQAIIDGAAKNPQDAAQIIFEEAGRLNRMVVELTDLVRLEAGRLSMKSEPIDMGQLSEAIVQRLQVVAERQGVQLESQTQPMPHIAGDGDRLAQVLTNLISNAIKFTPEGGKVQLVAQFKDGGVSLTVRDSGIGIPPHDLPRVFERFYQVDKARGPQRGTGLGLAITQEIIEAHGGTISVHSKGHNEGTTFRIWLPSPQMSTIISRPMDL